MKRAVRLSELYGVEADDLLHDACVRALSHRPPPCSAYARLVNCMRSIASTAMRDRLETKQSLTKPGDAHYPVHARSLQPDEWVQRAWAQGLILRGFDEVAANDDAVGQFIDAVCDGHRGGTARDMLGCSNVQFDTVKRRARRKVRQKFRPFVVGGRLQLDWPLAGAELDAP